MNATKTGHKKIGVTFWDYAGVAYKIDRYMDAYGFSYVKYEVNGKTYSSQNTQTAKLKIRMENAPAE